MPEPYPVPWKLTLLLTGRFVGLLCVIGVL